MALKKQIDSEKYLYARVLQVVYEKNKCNGIFVLVETRKLDTNQTLSTISLSFLPNITPEECAPFSFEDQNKLNSNAIASGYMWLKSFNPLFFNWEDV